MWVPWGPRSLGCRSTISSAPSARTGSAHVSGMREGDAVGVAGVGQHVCERDAAGFHAFEDGHERRWRVVIAGGEVHASGELGDLGAVLVAHGRGGLEVVAVEELVFLAGVVAAAVPPRRLGVGAARIIAAVAVAVAVA